MLNLIRLPGENKTLKTITNVLLIYFCFYRFIDSDYWFCTSRFSEVNQTGLGCKQLIIKIDKNLSETGLTVKMMLNKNNHL